MVLKSGWYRTTKIMEVDPGGVAALWFLLSMCLRKWL